MTVAGELVKMLLWMIEDEIELGNLVEVPHVGLKSACRAAFRI